MASNEELAARVAKLESMLKAQAANEQTPSSSRSSLPSTKPRGTLSVSSSGHVRYVPSILHPSSDTPLSIPLQATVGSIDLSSGPNPFGNKQFIIDDLLIDFPPRTICAQLKDVVFASFASVSVYDVVSTPWADHTLAFPRSSRPNILRTICGIRRPPGLNAIIMAWTSLCNARYSSYDT